MTNEAEQGRWNDDAWIEIWQRREPFTQPVTPYLLASAGLEPGERVLDIGSGGGGTSLAAAAAVGEAGLVVGADISVQLTALAVRRAEAASAADPGRPLPRYVVADVQQAQLDDAPFDAAISQFGVMFFDEPIVAFRAIRAALRPGGRLAFACWQSTDRNPAIFIPALAAFVPPPPPPAPGKAPTGPFALADIERTTAILDGAGFGSIAVHPHEIVIDVTPDDFVGAEHLAHLGVAPARIDEARLAVEAHFAPYRSPSGVAAMPAAFQIFTARDPGGG